MCRRSEDSTLGLPALPDVRFNRAALNYVEAQLALLPDAQRDDALRSLRLAAEIDGNRYLGLDEARHALEDSQTNAAEWQELEARLRQMRRDEFQLLGGVRAYFTSIDGGEQVVEQLLRTIAEAEALAPDHAVAVHALIFSFTLEEVGSALLNAARRFPSLQVRLLADWTQLSASKSQPRRLHDAGLDNVTVRFKKDQPFEWDPHDQKLQWSHSKSLGMNHHKLMLLMVDGAVRSCVCGSFNWSRSAMTRNYENVVVIASADGAQREVLRRVELEFEAFWNDGRVSMSPEECAVHLQLIEQAYRANPRLAPEKVVGLRKGEDQALSLLKNDVHLDVNDWGIPASVWEEHLGMQLDLLVLLRQEQRRFGRFSDEAQLLARLPQLAPLWTALTAADRIKTWFGPGLLSVNTADVETLVAVGFPRPVAQAIVERRDRSGSFESLEEVERLLEDQAEWAAIEPHLDLSITHVLFSARRPDEKTADGGFASFNEEQLLPVLGADGAVSWLPARLGVGALDLIRRTTTGELLVAMYELAPRSAEFAALLEAARRDVNVRLVLDGDRSSELALALHQISGSLIEARAPARTMHQKYVIAPAGGDVFNGSANMGRDPSPRHAENRFFFHNRPDLVRRFKADFEHMWSDSKPLLTR